MKGGTWRILLGFFIGCTVLVMGYSIVWIWAAGYPIVDPPPKGEGSYEELNRVFAQFRNYHRTGDTGDLPTGVVRLTGFDENGEKSKEEWMIYYATASHKTKRGGTIVLMGSDGRMDGYFGHHCSKKDGGDVFFGPKARRFWSGGTYYERSSQVREAFGAAFKHQRTGQAGESVGGVR